MKALALLPVFALVAAINAAPVVADGAMVLVDAPVEAEVVVKQATAASSTPMREFIPTHEWQVVEADQAIPAGLHVRMDMQTGRREAKLLEPSEQVGIQTLSEKRRVKLNLMAPLLARSSAPTHEGVPITDLSEEVGPGWQASASDVAQMTSAMATLQHADATDANTLQALATLVDLVDEIDNAHEFERMGGLAAVVGLVQSNRTASVRAAAARILGLVSQNNLEITAAASTTGTISALLSLLAHESQSESARAMFALSVLCRGAAAARQYLQELDGLQVMLAATQGRKAIISKAVVLITDIVLDEAAGDADTAETADALQQLARPAAQSSLGNAVRAAGWCAVMTDGLAAAGYDAVEKTLKAMILFGDLCPAEFATQHARVQAFQQRLRADRDVDAGYAVELTALASLVLAAK